MADDRINCADCADYNGMNCIAARTGRRRDVHARYCPDTSTPRRCAFFSPQRGQKDRRTGAERWPSLWIDYVEATPAQK